MREVVNSCAPVVCGDAHRRSTVEEDDQHSQQKNGQDDDQGSLQTTCTGEEGSWRL